MRVRVNGDATDVADNLSVSDLIASLGLADRRIAVELNSSILPRDSYATSRLRDGDVVEIVHFIGGG